MPSSAFRDSLLFVLRWEGGYGCNKPRVEDLAVQNDGAWRRSATKYLRQTALRQALGRLLQL